MFMQKTQQGFTLIEILMVVAILGFLTSIIVAVLSSAQDGARNSDRNEVARQYVIALGLYHNTYGVYPTGGCAVADNCDTVTRVCLGDGYTSNNCYVLGSHSENSTTNNQISEFIPGLPALNDAVTVGGTTYSGAAYGCTDDSNADDDGVGACKGFRLSWVLEGGADDVSCYGGATELDVSGVATICTYQTD